MSQEKSSDRVLCLESLTKNYMNEIQAPKTSEKVPRQKSLAKEPHQEFSEWDPGLKSLRKILWSKSMPRASKRILWMRSKPLEPQKNLSDQNLCQESIKKNSLTEIYTKRASQQIFWPTSVPREPHEKLCDYYLGFVSLKKKFSTKIYAERASQRIFWIKSSPLEPYKKFSDQNLSL